MKSFGFTAALTVSALLASAAWGQGTTVFVPIVKPDAAQTEASEKRGTGLPPFLAKKGSRTVKRDAKRGTALVLPKAS
ncbi:MAG: hypothetical protein AAFN27_16650 [Pseudomonadota bacterium]